MIILGILSILVIACFRTCYQAHFSEHQHMKNKRLNYFEFLFIATNAEQIWNKIAQMIQAKKMNFALFYPVYARCEFSMQHCAVLFASASLAVKHFALSDKTQQKHKTITKQTCMF